jgi:hypothetical protein
MKLVLTDALELRPILFHGPGFEPGQEKRGLARSPAHFRSYFRELRELGLAITELRDAGGPHRRGTRQGLLGRSALRACRLTSLDVVEINPALGAWGQVEQTYLTAMHFLIASASSVENREARRPSLRQTSGHRLVGAGGPDVAEMDDVAAMPWGRGGGGS